jgi:hypothetical protein
MSFQPCGQELYIGDGITHDRLLYPGERGRGPEAIEGEAEGSVGERAAKPPDERGIGRGGALAIILINGI